jgi:hypothetical protein
MVCLFMVDLTDLSDAFIIQGDSGRKVNILERDIIGHCEKRVRVNLCLILFGYRD